MRGVCTSMCIYVHVMYKQHMLGWFTRGTFYTVCHVIIVLYHCSGGFRDWFIRQQRGFIHGHGCTSSSRLQEFGNLAEIPRLHGWCILISTHVRGLFEKFWASTGRSRAGAFILTANLKAGLWWRLIQTTLKFEVLNRRYRSKYRGTPFYFRKIGESRNSPELWYIWI